MKNKITWKEFKIEDIFYIKDGYYNKKPPLDKDLSEEPIPFLGATAENNGITEFYNKDTILSWNKTGEQSSSDSDKRFFEGNCIAVTNNGSVGNAYYQERTFTCSHDITPLYLKEKELNKNLASYLIPLIEQAGSRFTYGRKWRPKRIRTTKMILPIINNEFAWDYMESKGSNLINNKKETILIFLKKELSTLEKQTFELTDLKKQNWAYFYLEDISEIKSGVRLTKADQTNGKTPFIGSTDNNNGITNFVSNINKSLDSNVLGVNYNGSVGYAFYHPYEALFSDDVKRVRFKNGKNNKFTLLFLATAIKKQRFKYQYGYKFNANRMKRQQILLPIDDEGNPNWDFMENYSKNIYSKKLQEAIDFLKNKR